MSVGGFLPQGPTVRGPIVHPEKVDSWAPGPNCPGPNSPGPNCPGPNLPRTLLMNIIIILSYLKPLVKANTHQMSLYNCSIAYIWLNVSSEFLSCAKTLHFLSHFIIQIHIQIQPVVWTLFDSRRMRGKPRLVVTEKYQTNDLIQVY